MPPWNPGIHTNVPFRLSTCNIHREIFLGGRVSWSWIPDRNGVALPSATCSKYGGQTGSYRSGSTSKLKAPASSIRFSVSTKYLEPSSMASSDPVRICSIDRLFSTNSKAFESQKLPLHVGSQVLEWPVLNSPRRSFCDSFDWSSEFRTAINRDDHTHITTNSTTPTPIRATHLQLSQAATFTNQ